MADESFDTPLVIETKEEAERLLEAFRIAEKKETCVYEVNPSLIAKLKETYNLR